MLDTKYVFPAFNILIYAQNYILKMASSTDDYINEENRDEMYKLYDFAVQLEPKPEREELTFSQQQLVNKARTFVTMKMKRRQNMREQKAEVKDMVRMKRMMSDKLADKQEEVIKAIMENEKMKKEEAVETAEKEEKAQGEKVESVKKEKVSVSSDKVKKTSEKPKVAAVSTEKPSTPKKEDK